MTNYVFKHRRKSGGKVAVARCWSGRYKLDGEGRTITVALGTPDKQVAESKLREIVTRKQREKFGLAVPEAREKAASASLGEHVAGFVADRERLGRSLQYTKQLRNKLERLIKECGWKRAADITGESFTEWRIAQTSICNKTLNEYQDTASGFADWLFKNRRCLAENPFRYVERLPRSDNETFDRRALSCEEIERLLAVAGPRSDVYLTAIYLGLRRPPSKGNVAPSMGGPRT